VQDVQVLVHVPAPTLLTAMVSKTRRHRILWFFTSHGLCTEPRLYSGTHTIRALLLVPQPLRCG